MAGREKSTPKPHKLMIFLAPARAYTWGNERPRVDEVDSVMTAIVSFARAASVAAVLALAASAFGAAQAATPVPSIFGTVEVKKTGLKPFPKWTESLVRFKAERSANAGDCRVSAAQKCHYKTWAKFIIGLRGKSDREKIAAVNGFMNRAKYVVDQINWGIKDFWATPGQFFAQFGDCEDYAIAKYLSLRALGFDGTRMRIVVVQDLNLKVAHAILAVTVERQTWILDNQIKRVIEAEKIRHYRPVYSVNEESWWLHKAS